MLPTTSNRTQPFESPLSAFSRNGENILDFMFNPGWAREHVPSYPANIIEDADSFHVEAELPGFTSDDVEMTFEDGTLCISATRKSEQSEENAARKQHLYERRVTKYERAFRLPSVVDEAKIAAKMKDGVLHVTLPKRPEVKPRRIAVK